jgi:hypothetical protein
LCGLAKSACISAELQSWSHFQGALMLLQACGDLVTRTEKFAGLINVTLTDAAEKVWLRHSHYCHPCSFQAGFRHGLYAVE